MAILCIENLTAQVSIIPVRPNQVDKWIYVNFPRIAHANPAIGENINNILQEEVLMNDTAVEDTIAMFANTRFELTDSSFNSGYTYMDFVESVNNESVFSVYFQLEFTGTYPESYQEYFNFDLATGKHLREEDLFSATGIKEIGLILVKERKKRIASWMKNMNLENVSEDSAWVRQSFEECNRDPGTNDFLLTETGILFHKGYCFPHVARSYDSDLDVLIPYPSLWRNLHEKGKKLLSFAKN